jgi:hypothetical protein
MQPWALQFWLIWLSQSVELQFALVPLWSTIDSQLSHGVNKLIEGFRGFQTSKMVSVEDVSSDAGRELPPVAPMLMESLRAVGYSTEAALADLIDNSIAAGAHNIAITFTVVPEPMVAVVDDGEGLSQEALTAAMRYGSRDPRDKRVGLDLGRFGLGLKTASLSQCRRVLVASKTATELSVAAWDLDICGQKQSWWLSLPGKSAIPEEILAQLEAQGRGTAVVWQKLDRMFDGPPAGWATAMDQIMNSAADHLALVFHRFLAGEFVSPFGITINQRALPRLDPFLEGHTKGQALYSEPFQIDGQTVTVSPFVLPFPSRLAAAELAKAGGRESLKTGHGFYIYRGGRLVVPGGWFRIVPSDELIRLARVRVDVPVELDHLWKVDIRKTVAEPPPALRPHLKRIVGQATGRSRRVYTHKGAPAYTNDRIPLWSRHDMRDGAAAWRINREHPLVSAALNGGTDSSDVTRLLKLVEELLPAHEIHLHIANDLPIAEYSDEHGALEALADELVSAFADDPEKRAALLDKLHLMDPFNRVPDQAREIATRLKGNDGEH